MQSCNLNVFYKKTFVLKVATVSCTGIKVEQAIKLPGMQIIFEIQCMQNRRQRKGEYKTNTKRQFSYIFAKVSSKIYSRLR